LSIYRVRSAYRFGRMALTLIPPHKREWSFMPDIPYYEASGDECAVFDAAWRHRLPLLIKGPTGCGKTRFVAHMAARLGLSLHTVACHDDLSAADLVGRHLLQGGATVWCDGPLTRAVREGGICYLDEVVEARKDTTVVLHPLADDRRVLPIERTGEMLTALPSFMLVVSYNPGYQNLLKSLKPSTRQRFIALRFDFPSPERERVIIMGETGCNATTAESLVQLGYAFRALKEHDLDEVPSTRLLIYAAQLIHGGMDRTTACRVALVEALTDDEVTAAALLEVVNARFA